MITEKTLGNSSGIPGFTCGLEEIREVFQTLDKDSTQTKHLDLYTCKRNTET